MDKEALKEMLQNAKDAVEEVFGPLGMRTGGRLADQVLIALLNNIDVILWDAESEPKENWE